MPTSFLSHTIAPKRSHDNMISIYYQSFSLLRSYFIYKNVRIHMNPKSIFTHNNFTSSDVRGVRHTT